MRDLLRPFRATALTLAILATGCASLDDGPGREPAEGERGSTAADAVLVEYLEFVTEDVDATCAALATMHGVTFGDPVPELGNARTAALVGGGRIGVRAPLAAHDVPLVRPYLRVDDIEARVSEAVANGAEVALPPMEVPGQGRFAIYFLGGVQHGLWEL